MVGAWGRGLQSGYGVFRVFAVVPPHAYLFIAVILFGHSRVILMWGVPDDRWVYERARIDSYVCVSVKKEDACISNGDRCSILSGLRDVYGSW